ncbi:acid phosphatase [Parvibaculum indicum]|uniref:5'-nucleotidase, lipoprotein e(P4) family n=1 Tax=Parvibaculum indicum TaxID=562969 RepID=UPI001FE6BF45|nr:HAD family acid phosphatase [Parvibaculum indicum]NIJ40761.1 acid phosphatase [Parvibaculum indicum]
MIGSLKRGISAVGIMAGLILAIGTVPGMAAETSPPAQNDGFGAALWMQSSTEYKAAALSAYALARIRLDEALADPAWTAATEQTDDYEALPPAVVVDVDETVLDNSAYMAHLIATGEHFSFKSWDAFVKDEVSTPIPGALAFAKYATSKGVKIFYVTNRPVGEKEATRGNLVKMGFPMGGNVETVLTQDPAQGWDEYKGKRRAFIVRNYRIVLLMGDNFGDFTDRFKGTAADRLKVFEADKAHWGHDWIMLPNPTYGSWEQAPFKGDYSLSAAERRKLQMEALTPWEPEAQ